MYLHKYKIYFIVDEINCELEVKANCYDDVKERFFEELKAERLGGLYVKAFDSQADKVIEKIRRGEVERHHITKTQKLKD